MRKLSNRELAHVAAMLSLLVLGVRCGPEMQGDSDDAHFTTQNALLVAERRALRLCVDPALELGPGFTSRPSPFRTFVHVLGEARAREVLGDEPAVRAHAELMRVEDHMAAEVSTSLVIRASALGTESFRQTWLPTGMGLKTLGESAEPASPASVK